MSKLLDLFRRKPKRQPQHLQHFLYWPDDRRPVNRYSQYHKGAWLVFYAAPTPETLKMARDDFESKYPEYEQCGKTVFVCTCMAEIDGAWNDAQEESNVQ